MTLVVVLLSATVAVFLVLAFAERPFVAIASTLSVFVLTEGPRQPFIHGLTLSTFSIQPLDICSALLVGGLIIRVARGYAPSAIHPLLLLVGVLTTLHLARGISAFGLQVAVNGARSWLWFASALCYAVTVPWRRRDLALVVGAGAALVVIGIVGLAQTGIRNVRQPILVNGAWLDPRPLTAAAALLLLQAAVLVLALRLGTVNWRVVAVTTFTFLVIVLQHRTVWAASIAVATVAVVMGFRHHRFSLERTCAAIGIGLLVLPVFAVVLAQSSTLQASFAETQMTNSTLHWRTASWSALLSQHHSASDLLIGLPSGSSWERDILGGTLTSAAPHSMYVEALLRFGVVGLLLFGVIWFRVLRAAVGGASLIGLPREAVYALLATQALFGFTYPLAAPEGLIMGALFAAAVSEPAIAAGWLPARSAMGKPVVIS